jgi:hypothetical protein
VQRLLDQNVDQRITVTEPIPTPVPGDPSLPRHYYLHANVPNPFNPSTEIRFDLPAAGDVHLHVYDVRGRAVRTLVDGRPHVAGRHHATWDGRDDRGNVVASGVYFYRIRASAFTGTRRMVLLK